MKKRTTLKKFALLISLCVTAALFVACGQTEEKPIKDDAAPEVEETGIDLYGYEFLYLVDKVNDADIIFGYNNDSTFADMARKRMEDIQEELNCSINFEYSTDLKSSVTKSISTASTIYSATQWANYSFAQIPMIRSDFFLPISAVSSIIDYHDTEKWGNKYQLECFLWNNDLYGIFPNMWPDYSYLSLDHLIVVNEKYVKDNGFTDPREYVESKQWNRALFADIVKEYTIDAGNDNITYGITCNRMHFFDITLRASKIELVKKTEDGTWVSGLHTSEAVNALQWAQDFVYRDCAPYFYPEKTDTYQARDAFTSNKAALLLIHSYFIFNPTSEIAYGMDDFGLLPFPLSDDDKSGNWIGQYENLMYGIQIPSNVEEPESSAYVLDNLYEPFEGFETKDAMIAYYTTNVFHDERDAELVYKMLENCRYTYRCGTSYSASDLMQGLSDSGTSDTVAAYLDRQKKKYDASLDVIINMYESMDAVWGE